jgi:hypothetical protein
VDEMDGVDDVASFHPSISPILPIFPIPLENTQKKLKGFFVIIKGETQTAERSEERAKLNRAQRKLCKIQSNTTG